MSPNMPTRQSSSVKCRPRIGGERLRGAHILELVCRRTARHEISLDHALAMDVENLGIGEATHQGLAHRGRVGTAFGGKVQGLGDCGHGGADDDLVGELGHLAGADRTDTGDAAHARENMSAMPSIDRGLAAGHDRERAVARAGLAAGHRRVDIADPPRRKPRRLGPAGLDRDRTHHHQHRSSRHRLGRHLAGLVRRKQHLLHHRAVAQHDDDDIGIGAGR